MSTDRQDVLPDHAGVAIPLWKPEPMRCPYCSSPGSRTAERLVRRRGQVFRSYVWDAICGTVCDGDEIKRSASCRTVDHD